MNTQLEQTLQVGEKKQLPFITYIGLYLALALPGIFVMVSGQIKPGWVLSEIFFWSLTLLILVIVVLYERQPLSSIGLGKLTWRSVAWGIGAGLVLFVLFGLLQGLVKLIGLPISTSAAKQIGEMPVWGIFLLALRAGVMEEVLFRGYPFERLLTLTGSKAVAAIVPLLVFIITHLSWGLGHLIFVTAAGGLITLLYLWKRNLWINIIAHFLVDFIAFMMIPLLLAK
ncbi:CPBP family intramembrane glutamic endopeptidase [Pontibacter cellulosilyticus]|uniref:CPBP family intramembrane metalloprotease n=1 Tax=Pontibacter cellulosilyticus TaxID=1720253 RepID=A0A923N7P2_9BACT|nr:type II CAAX endopeptidase family protein [Pontibacter cellulosilyticus]MBC5992000.1 CPBP family intramembrane metalloprotease [Pontibacter cellulosilyticus]